MTNIEDFIFGEKMDKFMNRLAIVTMVLAVVYMAGQIVRVLI